MHIITMAARLSFLEDGELESLFPDERMVIVRGDKCFGRYDANTTIEHIKVNTLNMAYPWFSGDARNDDPNMIELKEEVSSYLDEPVTALEAALQGDNVYLWPSDNINDLLVLAQIVSKLYAHQLMHLVFIPENTTGTTSIDYLTPVYRQRPVIFRQILPQETGFFTAFWESFNQGELHLFPQQAKVQNIQIPDWVTALEYVNFRYPFLENGLPRYLQALLSTLFEHDVINVRRLVGSFMCGLGVNEDSPKCKMSPKSYYGDVVAFELLYHLSIHPKLVEITPIDRAENAGNGEDYPYGQYNIKLTPKGRAVLLGEETVDLRHIELLRWWGGKDLCNV